MALPWTDVTISSWSELLEKLHSAPIIPEKEGPGGHYRSPYVFRGMSDSNWGLQTSLERLKSPPQKVESALLRSFRKYASEGIFTKESAWEVLSVAQHNGLPTRVLDWSVSPLIAAHFATAGNTHFDKDGVIWCVDVTILRDKVLPESIASAIKPAFVFDTQLLQEQYKNLEAFDETDEGEETACIFFEPPSLDARIANQFGLLSVMNSCEGSHDKYFTEQGAIHENLVKRIIIDKEAKPEIRDMLDQNNINERMLFPGLPGLCDWLRRYYGPAKQPEKNVLSTVHQAIECGELQTAERLITIALSDNPPPKIAEKLKDLFIQINLSQYLKRQGINLNINELRELVK
jgi:FRG domain